MYALDFIVRNVLNHRSVLAVRIDRGLPRLGSCEHAKLSVLMWWKTHFEEAEVYESDPDQVIQTTVVAGEEWPNMKYIQNLIGSDSDGPMISDVPEQPAQPYISSTDNPQDSAQHDNDDSPNRLSTIPEEDSQASYLVGPEQGPPDEIGIDGELWHQLDANSKLCLLEHAQVEFEDAGRFDEYPWLQPASTYIGSADTSRPDYSGSTDNPNLAQNFLSIGVDPEQFGYGEPDVDENGNPYVDI